jgi:hypothetical protein
VDLGGKQTVFFLLAIYCQIVKCDSDPTKERLKGHRQPSTSFTDLVASTSLGNAINMVAAMKCTTFLVSIFLLSP